MFQWAQATFDKLSQTVAPPPEDGPARFAYCLQRGEEDAAMGCIASMDPVYTVVNQSKGQYPIHLACQYSCQRLIQLLLSQPGLDIGQTDLAGNTPLHYASMSTAPNGLDVVKLLITGYGASVLSKNAQGQTPYDVATLNVIRQHLLPIQLQAETQIALDNGGQGLPPGIDMGGLRINNPAMPPPPTFGGGPPTTPGGMAPPPNAMQPTAMSPAQPNVPAPYMFGTPSPNHGAASAPVSAAAPQGAIEPAPTSRGKSHEYSRVGSSSAAIAGVNKYRADGFHSSSSDVSLQKKYGHVSGGYGGRAIAPPPSSGNSSVGAAVAANTNGNSPTAPSSGGPNPFAAGTGGRNRYGALNSRRYVTYGQVAGPSPTAAPAYVNYGAMAAPAATNVATFTPGGAAATSSAYGATPSTTHSAPTSGSAYPAYSQSPASGTPTTPYMPPPPYQSHNYASSPAPAQNSANMAESNAQDIFAAPSPEKAVLQNPAASMAAEPAPAPAAYSESAPVAVEASSDNWVETVDPTSGQIYYYNTITNETSWTKPSTEAALPENWVETLDPSSGRAYFYNSVTQETSWERPVAATSTVATEYQSAAVGETLASDAFAAPSLAAEAPTPAPSAEPWATPSPAPVSASDAFSAPPPAAEPAPALSALPWATPSPAPVSASDAFSAPPPSAADAFGAPPPTATSPTPAAPSLPSQGTPQRTISADELFAEDAPTGTAENDSTHPPSQAQEPTAAPESTSDAPPPAQSDTSDSANQLFGAPPAATLPETPTKSDAVPPMAPSHGEVDDDGMLDDIPLSPTLQRPVIAQPTPVAANGVPPIASAPAPVAGDGAESLFAAIGMPPPPFSARKR